ncbi:hypothetical protein ASPCADRAFT_212162 [Aspergillus carbonarius ITEM 5010]|uniref:Uncharacterized protein n=1 Tax=Aspergillus carbonarius (strain ITEM 5010) TaxID=602072 RepID=A0A1R3R6W7_ASPC5|nr:hypothetical protein ASPCADRAFT_212162 [Aspergillus carbonarius ITEM 5010]
MGLTQQQNDTTSLTGHGKTAQTLEQPPLNAAVPPMPLQGLAQRVPSAWVPYVQLTRVDRPGILAFLMPTLMGLCYGASILDTPIPPVEFLQKTVFCYIANLFLRGAACTWNDNLDQDVDRQVPRTRNRPIARGAVSTTQANIFTLAQVLIVAWILSYLPPQCLPWSVALGVLHAIYPLCKRVMDFAPAFLGLPFSVGMILPIVSLGINPFSGPVVALTVVEVAWSCICDTIYGHQDVKYDIQAGVGSMAVRFTNSSKLVTSILAAVIMAAMVFVGVSDNLTDVYFLIGCGGTAVGLAAMIYYVDLADPASCMYWFRSGLLYVGWTRVGGFLAQYLLSLVSA